MTRLDFLGAVYRLCETHGGSVTSGFRTRRHNQKVGGKPNSRHLTGFGMDVVLDQDEDGIAANDVEAFVRFRDDALELGLKVLDEGDHYHIQPLGPEGRVA